MVAPFTLMLFIWHSPLLLYLSQLLLLLGQLLEARQQLGAVDEF